MESRKQGEERIKQTQDCQTPKRDHPHAVEIYSAATPEACHRNTLSFGHSSALPSLSFSAFYV